MVIESYKNEREPQVSTYSMKHWDHKCKESIASFQNDWVGGGEILELL